ncbi:hypothetical protein JNK13_02730 [bacterium]|nr:hypothetical protein [bacterium]
MESRSFFFVILLLATLSGCADLDPNYGSGYGGYGRPDPYYNGHDYGRSDYYRDRERERIREEHRKLERERDHLENERDRLADQRRREEEARREAERREAERRREERCPAGFSPSERKCSSEERKHGCKDIRLDNGMGCVRR